MTTNVMFVNRESKQCSNVETGAAQLAIACLIKIDKQLNRIARWYGISVGDFLWQGIEEAAMDPHAGVNYLNDVKFELPEPRPRKVKSQRSRGDLIILDITVLKDCLIQELSGAPRKVKAMLNKRQSHLPGTGIERVATDTYDLIERCAVIAQIPRHAFEPYLKVRGWGC